MNSTLRNVLAVIAGLVIGSAVNMGIIMISGSIIPPPDGVDMTTPEGLKEAMPLLQPKHFLLPFLAHALGTLVGALVAVKIGVSSHMKLALIVGVFFLIGGIMNAVMIGSPAWINGIDFVLAYIPMAWVGWKLGS